MKRLNVFFFGIERVSAHDFVWFYGGLTSLLVIGVVTLLGT